MDIDSRSTRGQLLDLLREGHALTKDEVTEKLPIRSERHVRRLVGQLKDASIPVKARRRNQKKEYYLPVSALEIEDAPVPLTERQALALIVAGEAGKAALRPTPLSGPLEEAFGLLIGRLDRASGTYDLERLRKQWHFGTEPTPSSFRTEVFNVLVEALNRRRPVEIEYDAAHSSSAPRVRTVSPLVMAAPGGSWRCVAYCHYREAPRDFTLSRIEDISLVTSDVVKDPPNDFDPDLYFRERFGALGGETEVVRLLVEPDRTRYFREKEYHPTQVIEDERKDGRIVVSFEVAGLDDMASWVRSWGPGVTVLAPESLAESIRADAQELLRRHEEGGHPVSSGELGDP